MFNLFLEEYREKVYKANRRKLQKFEIAIFIIILISGISTGLFLFFRIYCIAAIPALIFISLTIFICIYCNNLDKRPSKKKIAEHKKYRTNELIHLLQSPNYNLYNIEGINWLLNCCKNIKSERDGYKFFDSIKNFFIIIFPIITLGLGTIIDKTFQLSLYYFLSNDSLSNITNEDLVKIYDSIIEDILIIYVSVIFFLILFAVIFTALKKLTSSIMFLDKDVVNYLENELEYVKTQLNTN